MRSVLIAFSLLLSSLTFGQEEIFTIVDTMPTFIYGGDSGLFLFIGQNLNYPNTNIQGKVYISFVVNQDGKIVDTKILKDIGGGCADEALRVIQVTDGLWKPGIHEGKPVSVRFNLPVKFTCTYCNQKADRNNVTFIFEEPQDTKLYEQSIIELKNNRTKTAMKYLRACLDINPKNLDALYGLGIAYYLEEDLTNACAIWKEGNNQKHESSVKMYSENCSEGSIMKN